MKNRYRYHRPERQPLCTTCLHGRLHWSGNVQDILCTHRRARECLPAACPLMVVVVRCIADLPGRIIGRHADLLIIDDLPARTP